MEVGCEVRGGWLVEVRMSARLRDGGETGVVDDRVVSEGDVE